MTGSCRKASVRTVVERGQVATYQDTDADGFPDTMKISSEMDRTSFRKWFTSIAEMQFYKPSDVWNTDQRDCAGLVRFSIREALRIHDRTWFRKMGSDYQAVAPDIRSFRLDKSPVGEKIFRTEFGSYQPSDLAANKFSEFADAKTLKSFNCVFLGRDRRVAEPGDLLFYEQPSSHRYPFHVMIFVGQSSHERDSSGDWVVYHTGASPGEPGEVRKVRLGVLDQHPDPRWRPVEANHNFLGFYRLKLLS